MKNLSELIIDTTIHGSRHLPKTTYLLSSAVALLLPRKRVLQSTKQESEASLKRGHRQCNDYYCELC